MIKKTPSPKSSDSKLIAPCGMNCSLCSGYLAFKNDVKSKGVKMPYCEGCRPREKMCAYLKKRCNLLLKKKVEFCYQCKSYPCEGLQHLDQRYKTHFHMSMLENLEMIRKRGVKKFLESQAEKWECSKCGEMICCHNGLCFKCDLEKLNRKKKRYRWKDE